MTIITHLQELDNLIVESTKPPVTAKLRNKLALIIEQAEAYQASSDKQDETLAAQAQTIERLITENQKLVAEQPKKAGGKNCPFCGHAASLVDMRPHPIMGEMGIKVHFFRCDSCGKEFDEVEKRA